jgi:hypothetical protein
MASLQAQAETYEVAYIRFENTITSSIFLLDIGETIARVATSIGLRVVWPGSEDNDDNDDDGQGKTLAAILGATGAA